MVLLYQPKYVRHIFLSIEFTALLLVTSWILLRYLRDNTRKIQEIRLQINQTEKSS